MTDSRPPLLQLRNIAKRFGRVNALSGVSFDIASGEVIALLGDNGAGKSTLVKIIAGNVQADQGEICFEGVHANFKNPAQAKKLGIETVYQDLSLCPNIDVVGNFFMGRELTRSILGVKVLLERDMELVADLALKNIGATVPSVRMVVENLSGGQRQAIELCRFAHWGGKLVILDEPFAALGVEQTRRGLQLIGRVKEKGIGVIIITHDIRQAMQVADRVVVLRHGTVVGDSHVSETNFDEVIDLMTINRNQQLPI